MTKDELLAKLPTLIVALTDILMRDNDDNVYSLDVDLLRTKRTQSSISGTIKIRQNYPTETL